jgi:hypothetical protein
MHVCHDLGYSDVIAHAGYSQTSSTTQTMGSPLYLQGVRTAGGVPVMYSHLGGITSQTESKRK